MTKCERWLNEQWLENSNLPAINWKPTGKAIQGDLDWIVMKSMEKDRERRYSSAQALADDLQRWLKDAVPN